jgi:S1-C subfamily serine protease
MRALSDQERQTLQTDHGVYVITVVDGTPAYASDILPGDILTAIDGSAIDGQEGLNQLLAARAGRSIEVTVLRQGKSISKTVSLRQ